MPPLTPAAMPTLFLPGVPIQAEVDRRLSVYEAWVEVEEVVPAGAGFACDEREAVS